MERLQSRARQLVRTGIATNTLSTYNTSLNALRKFRHSYNLPYLWPIPIQHIILFVAFCFENGHSPNTISTYVAGINYYHKLSGYYDLMEIFVINKLIEGCKRGRICRDNRAPLTKSILALVCNTLPLVCYNNYEQKLFSALFVFAYFGLFRVSELVCSFYERLEDILCLSDLSFVENNKYIIIQLRRFKTNQRGTPTFLKLPRENGELCPVRALSEYVFLRPRSQGPLFCHSDKTPVTRSQFNAVLSRCIGLTNYRGSCFKSHSFRIGRATDLSAQGYSTSVIMKLGRWKSESYRLYIR